jgi:uncharacterized protein YwqG
MPGSESDAQRRVRMMCLGTALLSAFQFGIGGCDRLLNSGTGRRRPYFAEDARPATSDLLALYRRLGYAAVADELERTAVPCLELRRDTRRQTQRPRPASRIGGRPDLPDRASWPSHNGTNLSFVAQVNLAEIPDDPAFGDLPREGLLYFFYDAHQSHWGSDPGDKGSWRVVHVPDVPSDPTPAEFPPDVPAEARFREVPVQLCREVSLRCPDDDLLSGLGLKERQQEQIADIFHEFGDKAAPAHQFLGLPGEIQGPMESECHRASHGMSDDAGNAAEPAREAEIAKESANWRLLLQVDSDDDAGMMWGDGGRLYFWIPKDALANRRFEDAWMILQCY